VASSGSSLSIGMKLSLSSLSSSLGDFSLSLVMTISSSPVKFTVFTFFRLLPEAFAVVILHLIMAVIRFETFFEAEEEKGLVGLEKFYEIERLTIFSVILEIENLPWDAHVYVAFYKHLLTDFNHQSLRRARARIVRNSVG